MYLLYLDESENSNTNRKNIFSANVLGLSGILITPRYATTTVNEFWEFKKKYNIPDNLEIHGFEIFSGSGQWKKLFTDDQRRDICKDLSMLVSKNNHLTKAWFCFKESELLKEDYLKTLNKLLNRSCEFVSIYGSNINKQILVIFDQKDEFERAINEFILNQRNIINEDKRNKKCRIIDHGFPGKSEFSELLQLSDFIGYVFRLSKTLKRKENLFNKKQDQRFIDFVDDLVKIMKTRVSEIKLK